MHSAFPFPERIDNDILADSLRENQIIEIDRQKITKPHQFHNTDARRHKADGNLGYLEFIQVVKALWEGSYPDIPMVATFGGSYASYPCIAYGMELKRSHSQEPKMRYRDKVLGENGIFYIIEGQRFQNLISFTIMVQANAGQLDGDTVRYVGAEVADRIVERFEDFMLEYTAVFKKLGASEFVYARRASDSEINMDQTDVIKRTVMYMLTTEKLAVFSVDAVEKIAFDVRQYISSQSATPNYILNEIIYKNRMQSTIVDLNQTSTPNY
jgi:hypothetical protein